jgi:hypothetical protein
VSPKEIKECMQLYLHESFKSVVLLMWGFLEITFTEEVEPMVARKLATVE